MKLSFEIEGQKELSRHLRKVSDNVKDFESTFRKVGSYLRDFIKQDVFESRGRVYGKPWKPLDKKYAFWKSQHYPGRGILEASGTLRKSFKYKSGKKSVVVSNTSPYFMYHQSNKPRKKIPRRVMMKLDEPRRQKIVKMFHRDLIYKLK